MKKKELLNEIMGVPKAIDFWVDNISWIIAGLYKSIEDDGQPEEATVTYLKDGQKLKDISYKGKSNMTGNDFMNLILELSDLNNLRSEEHTSELQSH